MILTETTLMLSKKNCIKLKKKVKEDKKSLRLGNREESLKSAPLK